MNFTAAWIGVFQTKYRDRCIDRGKRIGLNADEKVTKGCTPSFLPVCIRIECEKRNL
jgi:hypothetical protein